MWQVEMVLRLRHMINDLADTPRYSQNRLEELILVSALDVIVDVQFPTTYLSDLDAHVLTPDPTEVPRDDIFIALVCLKSACVLAGSEFNVAGGQAISLRDGDSAIDLKGILQGRKAVAENACKYYQEARWRYQLGQFGSGGQAIFTPIAALSQYRGDAYYPTHRSRVSLF